MMRISLYVPMLAALFCFCAAPARAEQFADPNTIGPGKSAAEIQALIEQLNAAETTKREDAEKGLLKIGYVALPQLKEALKSDKPEIAARARKLVAKLAETVTRPADTYASVLPEDTVFFVEARDARKTLAKLKTSPIGQFWDLPATQLFYKNHHGEQLPEDQKLLESLFEWPKLAEGKAMVTLGGLPSFDAQEIEPPLLFVLETAQGQALENSVRRFFDGINEAPKANRPYGPFRIDESATGTQTVFGQGSVIHAKTARAMETFLDNLNKRPEKPLAPLLKPIEALLPNFDFIYHLDTTEFQRISDDNVFIVDDDMIDHLKALGLPPGAKWQGAIEVTPDFFVERFRVTVPDEWYVKEEGEKPVAHRTEGFAHVLKQMAAAMPPAPKPGAAHSMDAIPWQAGLVVQFNGDTSKFSAQLAGALRDFDSFLAPVTLPAMPPKLQPVTPPSRLNVPGLPGAPAVPGQPANPAAPAVPGAPGAPGAVQPGNPAQPTADGANAQTIGTRALREAGLELGGAEKPKAGPGGGEMVKAGPGVKTELKKVPPHVARFEKLGLKMEQFFEQVDGPATLALFPRIIEQDDLGDSPPFDPLFSITLKDPTVVERALEAASAGNEPRFIREVLYGGTHYAEIDGDPELKPGFWIRGNRLLWTVNRDLLELACGAIEHRDGNERYADRPNYKRALAGNEPNPQALLTFFGDSEVALDTVYHIARINWTENDANPWPAYEHIRPLLRGKNLYVELKAGPNGLEGSARTPYSLFGLVRSVFWTLKEAYVW